MGRGHTAPRPARARAWLLAGLALAVNLGASAVLFRAGLPIAPGAARWMPAVGALLAYAVVVLLGLPRASDAGRVGATAGLWAAHVLLSLLNGAVYSLARQDRFTVAVIQAVWASPVLQALQVLWVVLALASFRHVIVKPRRQRRRRAGSAPSVPVAAPSPGLEPPPRDAASTEWALASLPEASATPPPETGAAIEESSPLLAPGSPIDVRPPAELDEREPQPASTLAWFEAPPAAPAPLAERVAEPLRTTMEVAKEDLPGWAEPVGASEVSPFPEGQPSAGTPLPEHEGPRGEDVAPLGATLDPPAPPTVVARERADELCGLAAAFTPFAPLLAPGGALGVDVHVVEGVAMLTVFAPRAAKEDLLGSIVPFLPCLRIASGRSPVDQLTLRGSRGVLVATPLGPPVLAERGGPVLVTGTRGRGSLALLELLSRRAAREYRPVGGWEESAGPELPDPIARLAGDLEALGSPITPAALSRDAPPPPRPPSRSVDGLRPVAGGRGASERAPIASQALSAEEELLDVFLDPELDPHAVGRLARALHRAARSAGSDGIGTIQSMALRIGPKQVIIKPVPGLGSCALVVVAGRAIPRSGLAQREVEITSVPSAIDADRPCSRTLVGREA